MRLSAPLRTGRLVGRRKRFFADIVLDDGSTIVAHCPNTGRMLGCLEPGAEVIVHGRASPTRKLPWTWVFVQAESSWVGVESTSAVAAVREAWVEGCLPELGAPGRAHAEVARGRSRIDLVLSEGERAALGADAVVPGHPPPVWVEVKATTWVRDVGGRRVASFPDAVTDRGTKQLADLVGCVEAGARAAVMFAVMRGDAEAFAPGDAIDPVYGRALRDAVVRGVEVYALAARVETCAHLGALESITWALDRRLPVML